MQRQRTRRRQPHLTRTVILGAHCQACRCRSQAECQSSKPLSYAPAFPSCQLIESLWSWPWHRSEVKQLAEYHQTLMKLRLEGGLDGIELGPVLGQGSFGRVYKGEALRTAHDSRCTSSHPAAGVN